jgi:hypothetical protein
MKGTDCLLRSCNHHDIANNNRAIETHFEQKSLLLPLQQDFRVKVKV